MYEQKPFQATPGPWRATKLGGSVLAGHEVIALIADGPDRKGNADLVAAAPQLLEACEILIAPFSGDLANQHPPEMARRIRLARAAISKAKGGG